MKKKVLIAYAPFGSGYKSSAEYIKNYFYEKEKYETMLINITNYVSQSKSLSSKVLDKVTKIPLIHNLFYGLSNNKALSIGNEKLCIKTYDSLALRKIITEFNPNIIIGTHYVVSYLITYYKEQNIINTPLMIILTDIVFHKNWIVCENKIDYFIVQNEIIKNDLIDNNINKKKIYPYGTPINYESLTKLDDKDYILKKYSLSGTKPIYLMFAGGSFGYNYTFDYFKTIVKNNLPIDIIFITGKNKELKLKCENLLLKNNIKNTLVLGYTKDIMNLINISDIVITKPGSSTLNECMLMGVPCILMPGLGGHETKNAKIMTKNHFGIKARNPYSLKRKIKLCLKYPFIVKSMKNKLKRIEVQSSIAKTYDLVDSILSKK